MSTHGQQQNRKPNSVESCSNEYGKDMQKEPGRTTWKTLQLWDFKHTVGSSILFSLKSLSTSFPNYYKILMPSFAFLKKRKTQTPLWVLLNGVLVPIKIHILRFTYVENVFLKQTTSTMWVNIFVTVHHENFLSSPFSFYHTNQANTVTTAAASTTPTQHWQLEHNVLSWQLNTNLHSPVRMNRRQKAEQAHSTVLPVASMASYPLGICGNSDRQCKDWGMEEEERCGREEVVVEEERNVTGCGDICQGNKRSWLSCMQL